MVQHIMYPAFRHVLFFCWKCCTSVLPTVIVGTRGVAMAAHPEL